SAPARADSPADVPVTSPPAPARADTPPDVPVTSPHAVVSAPVRGTVTVGTPGPRISAIPTARVWRSFPDAPRGKAARAISNRNARPRTGRGSTTRPPAPTRAVTAPAFGSASTRTARGTRTPGTESSVNVVSVVACGVVQAIHGVRPSCQEPIQGC